MVMVHDDIPGYVPFPLRISKNRAEGPGIGNTPRKGVNKARQGKRHPVSLIAKIADQPIMFAINAY